MSCDGGAPGPIPIADLSPGVRTFHGRVLLLDDGELRPLPGVAVCCFWEGGARNVLTDDAGRFDLVGIPFVPGTVELRCGGYQFAMSGPQCTFAGFDSTERSGDIVLRRADVEYPRAGEFAPTVDVHRDVAGTVVDHEGDCVARTRGSAAR
jgi:hypothetical protein